MRSQIKPNGISTVANYSNGDMTTLVNFRNKAGSLRPVAPIKSAENPPQLDYDMLFEHHTADGKINLIGTLRNDDKTEVWLDALDGSAVSISKIPSVVNSIEQVGNMLVFITDRDIYTFVWIKDRYNNISELPDIDFFSIKTTSWEQVAGRAMRRSSTVGITVRYDSVSSLLDDIEGAINEAREYNVAFAGRMLMTDAHFVVLAYQLYDGSYIKHTQPMLVAPQWALASYPNLSEVTQKDFIAGDDLAKKFIAPINICLQRNKADEVKMWYGINGYDIDINFDTIDLSPHNDIIKNISIFISPPLGFTSRGAYRSYDFQIPTESKGEYLYFPLILRLSSLGERLENNLFYKAMEIDLLKISGGSVYFPDLKANDRNAVQSWDDLASREILTPAHSNTIGAKGGYVYNQRLHLYNITETLFRGDYKNIVWHSKYNGILPNAIEIPGYYYLIFETVFKSKPSVYHTLFDYPYNCLFLLPYISYPDKDAVRIKIYSYRPSSGRIYWLHTRDIELQEHTLLQQAYWFNKELKPIEIPLGNDPITEVEPFDFNTETQIQSPQIMRVSKALNPLVFPDIEEYVFDSKIQWVVANVVMDVAERNYGTQPLYVATERGIFTLQVGSNVAAYSQQKTPTSYTTPTSAVFENTPYGVAFISQRGLYILNVRGVIFISELLEDKTGVINLLFNTEVNPFEKFTAAAFMEYVKDVETILYNKHENELIIKNPKYDYMYVYNFDNKQYYISTEKWDYTIKNSDPEVKVFCKSTDTTERQQKDYSETQITHQDKCVLLSRALRLQPADIQKLERIILRGLFYNLGNINLGDSDNFPAWYLFGSRDGITFKLLKGRLIKPSPLNPPQGDLRVGYKDFDSGLLTRQKWNYYIYGLVAGMDNESRIDFWDIDTQKNYNNDKMN